MVLRHHISAHASATLLIATALVVATWQCGALGQVAAAGASSGDSGSPSNGGSDGDGGGGGNNGGGHQGDHGGRHHGGHGHHKPPLGDGKGYGDAQHADQGLSNAANQMTPDRLHDINAINNLNQAIVQKQVSDLMFEHDVKSGNYDNSAEQQLRAIKNAQSISTLKNLNEALPTDADREKKLSDAQQSVDAGSVGIEDDGSSKPSPSPAADSLVDDPSIPSGPGSTQTKIDLSIVESGSSSNGPRSDTASANDQIVQLGGAAAQEMNAATPPPSSPSAILLGLGGRMSANSLATGSVLDKNALAAKGDALASIVSDSADKNHSAPAPAGSGAAESSVRANEGSASKGSDAETISLVDLARNVLGGKKSKLSRLNKKSLGGEKPGPDLDPRRFARVQDSDSRDIASIRTFDVDAPLDGKSIADRSVSALDLTPRESSIAESPYAAVPIGLALLLASIWGVRRIRRRRQLD